MLTFANTNSLAFWKTKLTVSKGALQTAELVLSRKHLAVCGNLQVVRWREIKAYEVLNTPVHIHHRLSEGDG